MQISSNYSMNGVPYETDADRMIFLNLVQNVLNRKMRV